MTSRPKFRRVHQAAGTFVILVVAAVIAAVLVTGHSHRWFTPMGRVNIEFPQEGTQGLKEGADVIILGTVVGSVNKITPGQGYDEPMTAELKIEQDFMRFVRQDSVVYIRQTLGIGDAFVEIKKGTLATKEMTKTASPLVVTQEQGTQHMIEDAVDQVRKEAIPAVKELRNAIQQLNTIEANVTKITDDVEHGQGPLGRLIGDPKIGNDLAQTMPKVNGAIDTVQAAVNDIHKTTATLPPLAESLAQQAKVLPDLVRQTQASIAQLQPILEDVKKTTSTLPETTTAMQVTMQALPGMVIQMQETLRQIQVLVEAAQKTWLLRSYVDQNNNQSHRVTPMQLEGAGQ